MQYHGYAVLNFDTHVRVCHRRHALQIFSPSLVVYLLLSVPVSLSDSLCLYVSEALEVHLNIRISGNVDEQTKQNNLKKLKLNLDDRKIKRNQKAIQQIQRTIVRVIKPYAINLKFVIL